MKLTISYLKPGYNRIIVEWKENKNNDKMFQKWIKLFFYFFQNLLLLFRSPLLTEISTLIIRWFNFDCFIEIEFTQMKKLMTSAIEETSTWKITLTMEKLTMFSFFFVKLFHSVISVEINIGLRDFCSKKILWM